MEVKYRGFTLEIKTASDMIGETNTYYSATRDKDQKLMVNMFEYGVVDFEPIINSLKVDIDDYYLNTYEIDYLVNTEKSMQEWLDDFIVWLESRNETIGGTIKPYVPTRSDDDF
jgi:hypothetical protein